MGCLLIAVLLCARVSAAEIEGQIFPERIQSAAGELVLNGAGVRTHSAFKVYAAALYLPKRRDDGAAILRENQPSRISLHLLRDLTSEQVISSVNSAIHESLTAEQRAPLERRLDEFGAIFDTLPVLGKGSQILIDYLPRVGTTIRVNGQQKGVIPGFEFNQALLRTWIGERPRDVRLKNAMLGVR